MKSPEVSPPLTTHSRYPPSDACQKLKDGLTALNYLEVSDREEMSDVEEVREILSCPGVRALLQSHDVVAHEVYGEEAVRVTPPNSSVNLTVGQDDVEGPNGECPPVRPRVKCEAGQLTIRANLQFSLTKARKIIFYNKQCLSNF